MAEEPQGQYSDPGYQGFEISPAGPGAGGPKGGAGQYSDPGYQGFNLPPPRPTPKLTGDEDEIIKSFGFEPEKIRSSPLYQTVKKKWGSGFAIPGLQADPTQNQAAYQGWLGNLLGAVGKGVLNIPAGVLQGGQHALAALGINDERDTPYMDLLQRYREENYRQNLGGTEVPQCRYAA